MKSKKQKRIFSFYKSQSHWVFYKKGLKSGLTTHDGSRRNFNNVIKVTQSFHTIQTFT